MNEKTVNILVILLECTITILLKKNVIKQLNYMKTKINLIIQLIECAFEKSSVLQKQDQQFFAASNNIDVWWKELKPMILNFDIAFKHYCENTGAIDAYGQPFHFTTLKNTKNITNRRLSCLAYRTW
jgi:hypothetical protein